MDVTKLQGFDKHLFELVQAATKPLYDKINELEKRVAVKEYPAVLTVKEASEILKVSQNRIRELARVDGFPALRNDGKGSKISIPSKKLMEWIEDESNQSII